MAFKTKVSHYGLDNINGIVLISTTENKSSSTVEAVGEDGYVVAHQTFGEKTAPSENYAVNGNVALNEIVIGSKTTVDNKAYVINNINITTTAGGTPSMTVTGQEVELSGDVEGCKTTLPTIEFSALHHAQTFDAFTIIGQGAHLTQSSLAVQGNITTAEKDGVILAHDIAGVKMTVNGTIQVSNQSYDMPVVSCSNDWHITTPLTEDNPDSNYPTYTFTATRYLSADVN